MSSFAPANILPDDDLQKAHHEPAYDGYGPDLPPLVTEEAAFGAPAGAGATIMSARGSVSPPSVFDQPEEQVDHYTEPTTAHASALDEPSYDLKPPPPSVSHDNVEALSSRVFSSDHLDLILRDHQLSARFTHFIHRYRPQYAPDLTRYVDMRKAMTAIEYANALADQLPTPRGHPPYVAAALDDRFDAKSRQVVEGLIDDALPAYVTHRLVNLITDTLVKEITGNNAPIMRELIPSLAEVYCVSDCSLSDNPIVYASEGETGSL